MIYVKMPDGKEYAIGQTILGRMRIRWDIWLELKSY